MGNIIIVEGKSDTRRLKEVIPNVETFETSGLGLDETKIQQLIDLAKGHKLIVFTDPDGPGELIRARLNENIDNLYHAYLPNEKALSKKMDKIGIEHAHANDIIHALDNLYFIGQNTYGYTMDDLIDLRIYNNKAKRLEFCNILNIAYGNNKKVLKQLNNFGITPKAIADAITILDKEQNGSS